MNTCSVGIGSGDHIGQNNDNTYTNYSDTLNTTPITLMKPTLDTSTLRLQTTITNTLGICTMITNICIKDIMRIRGRCLISAAAALTDI